MRLVKQNDGSIPVIGMKPGQVAVITKWPHDHSFIGAIVQRWHDHLVIIGGTNGWSYLFRSVDVFDTCYVRILQPGEILEV